MKTTSRWSFVLRGALVLCGLVVLSLVGRFAVAGGQVSPATVGGSAEPISSSAPPPLVVATAIVDASAPSQVAHSRQASEDDPVYLNEATVDDLRRLPGIGEKRALAVLELRRKLGHFKQVEDLLRVKGIGRSTLRKLRPLVRIDHPSVGAEAGSP
jgi:competence protein ComEA